MAEMTELRVYNTMTQQKEILKPVVDGKVSMYVCGVTAYDLSHLGHARAAVSFDVLYRYLQHLGYEVIYVRNFTDVDDKLSNISSRTPHKSQPVMICLSFSSKSNSYKPCSQQLKTPQDFQKILEEGSSSFSQENSYVESDDSTSYLPDNGDDCEGILPPIRRSK